MAPQSHNRRDFLKNLSLAVLGTSALGSSSFAGAVPRNSLDNRGVVNHKILGRTGFRVSDVASGAPKNETVLKAMLDSGVNFIDTGYAYGKGNNERMVGKVLKDYDRSKLFVNTKLLPAEGGEGFKSKDDVIRQTREALDRLQTDYADCVMIHGADNSKVVEDAAFHAGMDQLKAEGLVRSTGVSCHGSAWYKLPDESLDQVLLTAADTDQFDVFLMTYNFYNADLAEKVFKACEKKNIGTAIMKSSPVQIYKLLEKAVARYEEQGEDPGEDYYAYLNRYKERAQKARAFFKKYGYTTDEELINAAIIYVLQDPRAHTVCLDIRSLEDVKRYLALSGRSLKSSQARLLKDHQEHFGFLNCRIGCNACERACPYHLPVNTILRYNYYYQNKKDEKQAMKLYADLPGKKAELCMSCPGYCESACPYGVSARSLMAMAHQNLSFDRESFA